MAGKLGAGILTTRWLVRAPIGLFRAGLGFLFGGRLLLLEHVGRVSGERRFVVLEVLTRRGTERQGTDGRGTERQRADDVVIASGFGRNAQWFRNLLVNPDCHISRGVRRRVPVRATVIGESEATEILADYQAVHPRAWAELKAAIVAATGEADPEIPLVSLREI